MKKAKFLALCLLTLALVALLASCGGEKSPVGPDGTTAPDVTGTPDNPVEELPKLENLKINGTPVSEYKIIVRGTAYGAKYASEYLQKQIFDLTGHKLQISSGNAAAAFYVESRDSEDGMYHIEVENTSITLYGTGYAGASVASKSLIEAIGRNEEVTLESASEAMFKLNNVKKKLSDGKLMVGVIGASVSQGEGNTRPFCEFFLDSLKAVYPEADVQLKNRSIGGKNTHWGLYEIEGALLSEGYSDLFIISLGGNDGPYGAGYDEIALNYQSMIEKIYKSNPDAEIVMVPYGRKNEVRNIAQGNENPFMKAMLDVGLYYNVAVVDTTLELYNTLSREGDFETDWSKYIFDTVHPNNAGQALYGNMLWKSVKAALDGSVGEALSDTYIPSEPLFENSKVNAVKLSWDSIKGQIIFGTGDESGWTSKGRTTKTGSSISYEFEGIGLELGIGLNDVNPYMLLVQIYNEEGELVLEEERETGKLYHLYITNALEYGKYTLKLTVTRPSEKYPSERPAFALTEIMIIK